MQTPKPPVMVSACLLGIRCRYDAEHALCPGLVTFAASHPCIPFCPEQLGGLSTPRPSANIVGGDGLDVWQGRARLITAEGVDVTEAFKRGAEESARLAAVTGCHVAAMKRNSPSCGIRTTYCEKEAGMGVTAALFRSKGIETFELDAGDPFPTEDFLNRLRETP